MSWRGSGYPNVPLNYGALKQALITKGKSKTGPIANRSILFLYQRYVTAYFTGENITLKLHRTEIVHFHADGGKTLNADGWMGSQMTRLWFRNAGINVTSVQPNQWSPRQYVVAGSKFYDGMKLDREGNLLTETKPIIKNVPNAEAKALRKRLTKLGQVYRAFAMMHGTSTKTFDNNRALSHSDIRAALDDDAHEFDLELYAYLQYGGYWAMQEVHPYNRVKSRLAKFYTQEVIAHHHLVQVQ